MTVNPLTVDAPTDPLVTGTLGAPPPDPSAAPAAAASPAPSASVWRALLRNRNSRIALCILVPFIGLSVFSAFQPLGNSLQSDLRASLDGPSLAHLFGTDKMGRDVLARTFEGLRISLIVGFCAAGISLVGGMLFGTLAATMGKRVDRAVSTFVDMMMAFPAILLAVIVVSIFGGGPLQLIVALGFASMPAAIRLQRALSLSLASSTFMDAARMANAPLRWNLVKHMLPNTLGPMSVVASIYAAEAILAEAALSYLGLGIIPPAPSLGNIIGDGQNYLREGWWISTFPGLVIVLISISLHFLSDGIREQLDPASRTVLSARTKGKSWLRRRTS